MAEAKKQTTQAVSIMNRVRNHQRAVAVFKQLTLDKFLREKSGA